MHVRDHVVLTYVVTFSGSTNHDSLEINALKAVIEFHIF